MLKRLVKKARSHIAARRKYSTTISELSRLTDRELSDIGINRCDIPFVAHKHTRNK